ncbi:unnamed protein product [Prunus armeniaca]|uniref:Uncharacterized protein n=1 Tax=Prunus armeniaca TaxID=36596 RepID=A0A6J5V341_PRUAR|nr:unnamed protein product [Prunus armeniaca]CAB4313237.1 unnamed protein product [Prunus armeniaca]
MKLFFSLKNPEPPSSSFSLSSALFSSPNIPMVLQVRITESTQFPQRDGRGEWIGLGYCRWVLEEVREMAAVQWRNREEAGGWGVGVCVMRGKGFYNFKKYF